MTTGLPMLPPVPQQVDVINRIKSHCYMRDTSQNWIACSISEGSMEFLTRHVLAPGPTGEFWFPLFGVQSTSVTTGPPTVKVAEAATVV